jgi:CRISPR system Cascade subunit CasB
MPASQPSHRFLEYLHTLKEDRGALAALRRGLGRKPGEAPEMFPYIFPWLPASAGAAEEQAYFLVASLFAYHPLSVDQGNLGSHLAATIRSEHDRAAVERRFVALLKAHPDDLASFLRQAVSFLKSKDVGLNWDQLFRDLRAWDHPEQVVQKNWARGFWSKTASVEVKETQPDAE